MTIPKYEGNTQDEQIDLKDAVPPQFHKYLDESHPIPQINILGSQD